MKKLWIGTAFALMMTPAHAGEAFHFEFGIGGNTAHIELPKNCRDLSCLKLSLRDQNGKAYTSKDLKGLMDVDADQGSKVTNDRIRSPFTGKAQIAVRPAAPATTAPRAAPSTNVPAAESAPAPDEQSEAVATRTEPTTVPPAAKRASTGPLGEWLVEDGSAQIRIEECGPNLCGYVSHTKNPNDTDKKNHDPSLRNRPIVGMPILLDMKPVNKRWEGMIYNARDGNSYSARIAMRNANTLRVEGCAMGGLFCGGQNWKRVD
jgi:uncharacterized protein (DUF2147 family)